MLSYYKIGRINKIIKIINVLDSKNNGKGAKLSKIIEMAAKEGIGRKAALSNINYLEKGKDIYCLTK